MGWITLQNRSYDLKDIREIAWNDNLIQIHFYSENRPDTIIYEDREQAEKKWSEIQIHLPRNW